MITPHTPWLSQPTAGHETHGQSVIYDEASGKSVALVYEGEANAAFIVKACNAHAELVEALTAIQARLNGEFDNPALVKIGELRFSAENDCLDIVNAILAKVQS